MVYLNQLISLKNGEENPMYNKHGVNNPFSKRVIQYDLDGNFIKMWDSIKDAQQTLKISHISRCCLGKSKTAGGYVWKHNCLDKL